MDKFKCNTCGEEKDVSEFYKKKSGHEKKCKVCRKNRMNEVYDIRKNGGIILSKNKIIINNTVKCTQCNLWKDIKEFGKEKRSPSGIRSECKSCKIEYLKKYRSTPEGKLKHNNDNGKYRKNNNCKIKSHNAEVRIDFRNMLWELKSMPCADCGQTFHPVCMDFDHLDGYDKKYNIGMLRAYKNEIFIEELNKTELICSNCHRIRTKLRIFIKNNGNNESPHTKKLKQWVDDLKKDKICTDCNKEFISCAMDWDHVRGNKLFNISSLRQKISIKNKNIILQEIEKCELVCSNCHRIRTRQRLITNKKTFY